MKNIIIRDNRSSRRLDLLAYEYGLKSVILIDLNVSC